jgi:hypothetical protein
MLRHMENTMSCLGEQQRHWDGGVAGRGNGGESADPGL